MIRVLLTFEDGTDEGQHFQVRGRPYLKCSPHCVLDMQRMMLCNDSVGTCSSRTGWTEDGLHVSRPVNLQYVSLLANTAADLGERCRGSDVCENASALQLVPDRD